MKGNTKGCTKGPKNKRKPGETPYESPTKALRKPTWRTCVLRNPPFRIPFRTPFRTHCHPFVPLSYPHSLSFFWYGLLLCVTFYSVA